MNIIGLRIVFIKIYENIAKTKAVLMYKAVRYKKITKRDHLTTQLYITLTMVSVILPPILYAIAKDIKYLPKKSLEKILSVLSKTDTSKVLLKGFSDL